MTTRAIQIDILLAGIVNPTTGEAVGSGTVYFYAAGTLNAKQVWTEKEKTNAYTSYSLSGIGTAQLYGEGNYKFVVKDSNGSTVLTLDNIRLEYPYYGIRSITQTGVHSQLSQDDFLLIDTTSGAVTINCLAAASWLRPLKVQRISGANNIVINPNGIETIDNAASLTISSDAIVEIISDSSNLRSAGFRSSFSDADNDTYINLEQSADEDIIHFYNGGSETVRVSATKFQLVTTPAEISKPTAASYIILCGGSDSTNGAAISLYGDSHASAGKLDLATGNVTRISINSSGDLSGSVVLDEDDMASNSATRIATQQSIKAYSDSAAQTMTNKTLTSPVLNTSVSGTAVLDEDNMASNSATQVATQQSIKAYVDSHSASSATRATASGLTIGSGGGTLVTLDHGTITAGDIFIVEVAVAGTKQSTAGLNFVQVAASGGTSVCETLHKAVNQSLQDRRHVEASQAFSALVTGVFICTTGGTGNIVVSGSSAGSDTTTATADVGISFLVKA